MKTPDICRYCGSPMRRGNIREVYGKGNKDIYVCTNCNAFVTCHQETGLPMGKPANAVLRLKRQATHNIFDSFWKRQKWSRTEAYRWLAESMGMPSETAHIANFEMDECEQVIQLCRAFEKREAA